ncbi:pilin [Pseudomonas sp. ZM23]|uniref:Pilin n=1 Tax=Pseudomonas triclosanedens TaxID=2961893 RepID=A0ABY7A691_9PSED|nr:pilin [Pseudomonas triclosanedens]MCP8469992.1 pilin [Pseudomonas triclosanedens]MCP8477902.1 pilin [Pseudomonas triclosanedens]WAI52574.1 pilin [Pseudomonas triclosanedens]
MQATAGIQGDVAVDTANAGSLTATTDTIAAAQDLEGKYFKAKSASVTSGGIISVKFDSGALNGQTMTLTPTLNAAKNQIASWKCTGLSKNNTLPSGCR